MRISQLQSPESSRKQRPVGPPKLPSAHTMLGSSETGPQSLLAQERALSPLLAEPPLLATPPAPLVEVFPALLESARF